MVWSLVVGVLVNWSEVVVSMSRKVVNNWAFMVRSFMMWLMLLMFLHQVFHTVCSMRPSSTMTSRRWIMTVIMESSICPMGFSIM